LKISPPQAKGSCKSLVKAEYHGLLRRITARSNQGRNDGGQKGHNCPGAESITMRAPNDCGGRRKFLTMSQIF